MNALTAIEVPGHFVIFDVAVIPLAFGLVTVELHFAVWLPKSWDSWLGGPAFLALAIGLMTNELYLLRWLIDRFDSWFTLSA